MMTVCYDLETDGLDVNTANILECSAMRLKLLPKGYTIFDDIDYFDYMLRGVVNLYFYRPQWDSTISEVTKINGLTPDMMNDLCGENFDENLKVLFSLFSGQTILMGKNSKAYDNNMVNNFLRREMGGTVIDMLRSSSVVTGFDSGDIDVQDIFAPTWRSLATKRGTPPESDRKKGTLGQYVEVTETQDMIQQIYDKLPKGREGSFHTALYDAVSTFVVYEWWLKNIYQGG